MAKYKPYVPPETSMKEFSVGAIILGLLMCVILGAANAYLGLKAGMTIAATYPAAVIGMAAIRLWKGNILEENLARTVGSIGESVAAGAIFTIPGFFLAGVWTEFGTVANYLKASVIMLVGGFVGILFVTILRRVMVEDAELVFPESVAAGEIHKAGRAGATGAQFLFGAMGLGALIKLLGELKVFAAAWDKFIIFKQSSVSLLTSTGGLVTKVRGAGGALFTTPGVSPAYMGVGYIIGPGLAALNFSGGLLSWGLFVPLLLYFKGPELLPFVEDPGSQHGWVTMAIMVWKFMVRPIAIGGMLVSAAYTLYRMRKSLATGLGRAVDDVKKAGAATAAEARTERDLNFRFVFIGIVICAVATFFIYNYFAQSVLAALVATIVMVIAGFFFAAVSGYLVGILGSSNNPISGLTLSTLVVAALLMVLLGMKGAPGVAATLGVAAVICVAAAVAGEMLQDLKVGHILGGTPWKMQVGDFIGVVLASFTMFIPLVILHQGDINAGGTGFGGRALPAPQAGLMALLSQGIVGGEMAWPLLIVGILMAAAFILIQVRSPMLVFVGMYLPLETTFAIFVGGVIRWIAETVVKRREFNDSQKARVTNTGVLVAAGLIAGEALIGLLFAALAFFEQSVPAVFANPSFITSLLVFVIVGFVMVYYPVKSAGDPDAPPPPSAVM